MKKNEFYVFLPGFIILLITSLCSILMFVFATTMNDFTWEILGFIAFFMLVILPLGLLLWIIIVMMCKIRIDETGISRIRFGKVIRKFLWEDITEIKCISPSSITTWLFFATKSLDGYGVTMARLSKHTIYLVLNDTIKNSIKEYCKNEALIKNI